MTRASWRVRMAALLAAAGLAGCTTPLSSESMMPGAVTRAPQPDPRSLHVAPVTGGDAPNPLTAVLEREYYVGPDELHVALVDSFEDSGMFTRVSGDEPGDLDLHTHIVSQVSELSGVTSGGATVRSILVVYYRLRESATGRDVWRDTIVSRGHANGGPEGPPGATRKSLASAAQRNLTEMLEKLSSGIGAAKVSGALP